MRRAPSTARTATPRIRRRPPASSSTGRTARGSSSGRRYAISRGTTRVENNTMTPSSRIARAGGHRDLCEAAGAGSLSSGRTIISGTTARSCTTRMPSITRLDSVPSRPCAWIVFSATIVLDSEMSAPNQSAGRHSHPSTTRRAPRPSGDRQDDLNRAADERDRADRRQLAERQLEPQREQQQRDAELGQLLDVVDVADGRPAGERADEHAGEDVPDDQRLPEPLRQVAADQRGEQDEREIGNKFHGRCASAVAVSKTTLVRCLYRFRFVRRVSPQADSRGPAKAGHCVHVESAAILQRFSGCEDQKEDRDRRPSTPSPHRDGAG